MAPLRMRRRERKSVKKKDRNPKEGWEAEEREVDVL